MVSPDRTLRLQGDVTGAFLGTGGKLVDHGPETVAEALEAALEAGRCNLMAMAGRLQTAHAVVEVPAALQSYEIEAGSPTDYDALLRGGMR